MPVENVKLRQIERAMLAKGKNLADYKLDVLAISETCPTETLRERVLKAWYLWRKAGHHSDLEAFARKIWTLAPADKTDIEEMTKEERLHYQQAVGNKRIPLDADLTITRLRDAGIERRVARLIKEISSYIPPRETDKEIGK